MSELAAGGRALGDAVSRESPAGPRPGAACGTLHPRRGGPLGAAGTLGTARASGTRPDVGSPQVAGTCSPPGSPGRILGVQTPSSKQVRGTV